MRSKGIILLFLAVFPFIFLQACLTTGDRVNMEEFKRQLEAGGQSMTEEQKEQALEAQAVTETAAAPAAEAAEEPTEVPTEVPAATTAHKPAVHAVKTEVEPVEEVKTEAPVKEEAAAVPETKPAEGNYGWILVAVFAAAFAVFALIAFILSRKKNEKDNEASIPEPGIKPVTVVPEKAVGEYRETAAYKPVPEQAAVEAPEPEPEQAQADAPAEEQIPEQKVPEQTQEQEGFEAAAASAEPAPPPPAAVPLPEKQGQCGEGLAGISPTQFAAGSQGNAVHLLYKVGGDSPEYRTIKITIPDGWSRPSTINTDEGYFTASVNGGRLISTAAEGMSMIITVHGLPADHGELAITYGERRGGGPGVRAQPQPGEAVFKVETEARGSTELMEIDDSPVVDVN